MANYWSLNELTKIEFFGKYMSRKRIMANLHVNDNTQILPEDNISHDPLHMIRPLVEMCSTKFLLTHQLNKKLSLDKAGCPFK